MKKIVLIMAVLAIMAASVFAANTVHTDKRGNLPWVIDTTGTLTTDRVKINYVIWFDCDTDDDQFVLKDTAGNIVYQDTDGEAGKPHVIYPGTECTGLSLETLDSGYLLIGVSYATSI